MRIGMLSQWYPPEPGPASLPGVLAEELVNRGHSVNVLTGFPNYPTGVLATGYRQTLRHVEWRNGVQVRRVPLYPSHDGSPVRRAANYASFGGSAALLGSKSLRDVDALWVNYSPVTVGLPMLAERAKRRTPTVVHVLDLWPDTLTASGFAGSGRSGAVVERRLHAWCRRLYEAADVVAYISPGVGDVLESRGVPRHKLAYAPMWADEARFRPEPIPEERGWGVDPDEVALVYAGTLGRAQGLEALVQAAAQVRELPLKVLIAGSGVEEGNLRDLAGEVGATNVQFLGRISPDRMPELMAAGDVHYVALNSDALARITMPSKIQATLAAGRPIIGSLVGDSRLVVRDSGSGWTADPGDVTGLVQALHAALAAGRKGLAEMGVQGRAYYEAEFSLARGVDRIEGLLSAVRSVPR